MAAAAAETVARVLRRTWQIVEDGLEIVARTGDVGAAVVHVVMETARIIIDVMRNPAVARLVAAVGGVVAILSGTALILEDWGDFLTRFDHFHHWMLGLALILVGVLIVALAYVFV